MITVLDNGIIKAELSSLGATVTKLFFENIQIADKGITVGRFANRIGKGEFSIGDEMYVLSKNENGNTLHGGEKGFSKCEWTLLKSDAVSASYELVSPDGDQGFPGEMTVRVDYSLFNTALRITYEAVCDRDTAVNLTNHMYFNLNGVCACADSSCHTLYINADRILETDQELIPTGKYVDVTNTRFDFRKTKDYVGDYDHSYIMNEAVDGTPQAVLTGKESRIYVEVYSAYPSIQLYNTPAQICIEAQRYPDAVRHAHFPSAILRKGESFTAEIVYNFGRND